LVCSSHEMPVVVCHCQVHERSVESDFLLIYLQRLCHLRTDLQVVLMSATLDAHKFSTYFASCPVVNVPGQSFPVEVSPSVHSTKFECVCAAVLSN